MIYIRINYIFVVFIIFIYIKLIIYINSILFIKKNNARYEWNSATGLPKKIQV